MLVNSSGFREIIEDNDWGESDRHGFVLKSVCGLNSTAEAGAIRRVCFVCVACLDCALCVGGVCGFGHLCGISRPKVCRSGLGIVVGQQRHARVREFVERRMWGVTGCRCCFRHLGMAFGMFGAVFAGRLSRLTSTRCVGLLLELLSCGI